MRLRDPFSSILYLGSLSIFRVFRVVMFILKVPLLILHIVEGECGVILVDGDHAGSS